MYAGYGFAAIILFVTKTCYPHAENTLKKVTSVTKTRAGGPNPLRVTRYARTFSALAHMTYSSNG